MTLPAALKVTYEDYVLLPEDRRYEVIDGELFLTPAPTLFHQAVLSRLTRILEDFVEARHLGVVFQAPCDVVLSKYDVFQPDAWYVSTSRRPILTEMFVAGAPDLVVEVLSPSTEDRDRIAKAKRYATFGVREMWILDPEAKTVEVLTNGGEGFQRHILAAGSESVRSAVLPDLEFAAGPIFRPI